MELRRHFITYRSLALIAGLMVSGSAGAQIGPPAGSPTGSPTEAAEAGLTGPTEAEINDWLARVDASSLADDAKKVLKDSYAATLGFVQALAKSKERTTQLEALRDDAPRRLSEEVQPALEKPAPAMPTPDPIATLAQWELEASQAKSNRDAAEKAVTDLEDEKRKRNDDRTANPVATQTATSRIAEIERDLESIPATTDALDANFARRQRLQAERRHLKQRLVELKAELASYDARSELFNRRVELAAKQRKEATELSDHWARLVTDRRTQEANDEVERASMAKAIAERLDLPALKDATRQNLELANLRTGDDGLPALIQKADARLAELEAETTDLRLRFKLDRDRVDTGLSDSLGQYLHSSRRLVFGSSTVEEHLEEIRRREDQLRDVALNQVQREEEERLLNGAESRVDAAINETAPDLTPARRAMIAQNFANVYRDLRSNLVKVQDDYVEYSNRLKELDARQKALVALGQEYREYLTEKVLWIRSSSRIGGDTFLKAGEAIGWLARPSRSRDVVGAYRQDLRSRWFYYVLLLGVLAGLRTARRRVAARRVAIPESTPQTLRSPLAPVAYATCEAISRALPLPIILWFLGWRAEQSTIGWRVHDYATTLSAGFEALAVFLLSVGVIRQILRPNGLADRMFGWPSASIRSARLSLRGLAGLGAPLLFVFGCFGPEHTYGHSIGRLAFIGLLIIGPFFAWRLRGPFEKTLQSMRGAGKRAGTWTTLYMVTGFWMPLVLAGLSAWGYHWTATQLADSLLKTGWLFMLLMFAFTVFDQWFQYHRRLIALERLSRRREELIAEPTTNKKRDDARNEALAAIPTEPDEVDLRKANEQTRSLLRNGAVILFLLGLWGIWGDVLPALRVLDGVKLWTVSTGDGSVEITLVDLLTGLSFLALMTIISANVTGFLDLVVLKRLPVDPGTRYAIVTLVRYGIGATGIALAFGAIGLHWGDLQWLVAALMVGLGFGLQEIFGNLVSGLILLLERPVRVGDTVTVNGQTGLVTRIRMRATTISDWDRKELVIPNKSFITNDIVNWSLTDPMIRLVVPIGVAYGTDVKKVEELLLKAARDNRDVLIEPGPSVVFQTFGDSSLNFDLRVFVPNIDRMVPVRHNINRAINALFAKNGIKIPFPQRDVHMHMVQAADGVVTVMPKSNAEDDVAMASQAKGSQPVAGSS